MIISKNLLLAGTLLGLTVGSLNAQWMLVEDWEGYPTGAHQGKEVIEALDPKFGAFSQGSLHELNLATGIDGIGGTNAAWYWFGQEITSKQAWLMIALPEEIPVDGSATIYFRVWAATDTGNYHISTAKPAIADITDGVSLWSILNTTMRVTDSSGTETELQVNNGGYTPSTPPARDPIGTWTEFWMVIDNKNDPDNGDGWELWKKGINDMEPTVITFGGDNPYSRLVTRDRNVDSIKNFVLSQNSDKEGTAVWLIDDIYMSVGKNLTDPMNPPAGWCGMTKVDGNVDTGSFMNWLYVGDNETGTGWAYSYDLNKYVYLSNCPADAGAWVYVSN